MTNGFLSAVLCVAAASASHVVWEPGTTPGVPNCTEHTFEQRIDHFNWNSVGPTHTYNQRYFMNTQYWKPQTVNGTKVPGPIFFYFGNEDNVELYVNHTGLMWESAKAFGAALVFGEHRFYGKSNPFADGTPGCLGLLTTEQAMADFAELIYGVKAKLKAPHAPVIGFGGSYGGMIGAWFRLKYPNAVDGVIAASSPIWSFLGLDPPYNPDEFYAGVAFDATKAGGATDNCSANLNATWPRLEKAASTDAGRELISKSFKLCSPLAEKEEVYGLMDWLQMPWSMMAMGNYPYPSSYIMHGDSDLPAYPVRLACKNLGQSGLSDPELFVQVRKAVAVYRNNTGNQPCFNALDEYRSGLPAGVPGRYMTTPHRRFEKPSAVAARREEQRATAAALAAGAVASGDCRLCGPCKGTWDYQWCTEMVQPFTSGCGADFLYPCSKFNLNYSIGRCQRDYNVDLGYDWAAVGLGGKHGFESASNIVFSNGKLDPWHGGGVLTSPAPTVVALLIDESAHHLDLMFSNPADPQAVIDAREVERDNMRKWVAQAYSRHLI